MRSSMYFASVPFSNLIVVPHVGSATVRTRERMAEMAVENLIAALAGHPMPYPAT